MAAGVCREKVQTGVDSQQALLRLDVCTFPQSSVDMRAFIAPDTCKINPLFQHLPKELVERLDTPVREVIEGTRELVYDPKTKLPKTPHPTEGRAAVVVTHLLNVIREREKPNAPRIRATGDYTKAHADEVARHQANVGLPVTGRVDSHTIESLYELARLIKPLYADGAMMGREFMWRLAKKAGQNPRMARDETPEAQQELRDYTVAESLKDPLALQPPEGARDAKGRKRNPVVSPALIMAVTQGESAFNPKATSEVNAQGLMQLMPETSARHGVANPYDITQNVYGGARVLRHLLELYNGDTLLAAAGFFAGEGNVNGWLKSMADAKAAAAASPVPLNAPENVSTEKVETVDKAKEQSKPSPNPKLSLGEELLNSEFSTQKTKDYMATIHRNLESWQRELVLIDPPPPRPAQHAPSRGGSKHHTPKQAHHK